MEDPDVIRLEYISEGQDDSSLHLTMHLAADLSGRVYLKGAEVMYRLTIRRRKEREREREREREIDHKSQVLLSF